jgi:hypothetical protein
MKKATRYTWKQPAAKPAKSAKAAEAVVAAATETALNEVSASEAAAPEASAAEAAPETTPAPAPESAPVAEAAPAPAAVAFDSFDEAKAYLLATARDKVIRSVEQARLHGKNLELLPPGEIRYAVEGSLERQRRFPLDTANALRGRLRREHFTIFKKGSKGVSYVCAVKRKFRVPGQTFSDSIGALIAFIEANPMVKAGELGRKFLNIAPPPPAAPVPAGETAPAPVEQALTVEQRDKLARLQSDLPWLVREGYVTEFIDGTLYAPPAMVEARKREVEAAEHDPENFPEAPAASAQPAPVAAKSSVAPVVSAPAVEAAPVAETAPATAAPVTEEPKSEPPAAPTA